MRLAPVETIQKYLFRREGAFVCVAVSARSQLNHLQDGLLLHLIQCYHKIKVILQNKS